MDFLNLNNITAVQYFVGVGSLVLAILLMLIKIPTSDYTAKLTSSKRSIVMSFLICSFMMFYTIAKASSEEIRNYDMFSMLTIYVVVHFSISFISHSMIMLLKTERHKSEKLFIPGMLAAALSAFLLLDSYGSDNTKFLIAMCILCLGVFLIESVTYIIHFDEAYRKSVADLEEYYDDDESHKLKWVRFCYVIAMLTNLFFLVYLLLWWFLPYKFEVAQIYTLWYLLYMLYLSSNFISFLGSHKLVLDAIAHKILTGQEFNQIVERRKRSKGKANASSDITKEFRSDAFAKLDEKLAEWVSHKRFCEYDRSRDEIARELGTSKEVLHAYFTTRIGVDFRTWRTQLRLEEAKRLLLENKNTSINIIAEMSGFSDKSNFHRQFVKFTGVSPRYWRDSNGKL